MKKAAFTLVEVILTIFLIGVISVLAYSYLSSSGLNKYQYKTTLQSQINLIESMVFQCKSLSEQMPNQVGGADALDTNLTLLECNTSTPYTFDGGRNGFVPIPPTGFTAYTATESGTSYYIATTAANGTVQDETLISLALNYTSNQAQLSHDATTATFKFYLSR